MISTLTNSNAQVVLNAAYHQLVKGKRQRFTFWKQDKNGHTWTMYKMKRNSHGIFWVIWEWTCDDLWGGKYTEQWSYQLADKNYQPLDYPYHMKKLQGWHRRETRIADLAFRMKVGISL